MINPNYREAQVLGCSLLFILILIIATIVDQWGAIVAGFKSCLKVIGF